MRIVRYLMQHKLALLLVVALLIVQAMCDLSLPNYTSDIVDVGIQQGGIEDAATTQLSVRTHDLACMLANEEEEALIGQSYTFDSVSETYALTDYGRSHRAELDTAMELPLVVAWGNYELNGVSVDDLLAAYQAGMVSKQQVLAGVQQMRDSMGSTADTLLEQQGIAAAAKEYAAVGVDVNQLQMDYLIWVGLLMLGLSCLSMLASIAIGFVASQTGTKIGRSLRERLFNQVLSFSDKEIDHFGAASLITRGTNDIQLIQMVCIILQRVILYAPILAIGGIIMVLQHTASMWWIVAAAVVAVFVVIIVLLAFTMPKFKIMQKLIDKVNLVSREQLNGMPVVRAFGREAFEEARFETANRELMSTQLFTNRAMSLMMPALMLVMNGTSVLIVWIGASYVDLGTIQTGDLIALITYSMMIVMSFLMIGMVAIMLPRASVAAGRIDEVIETVPSIADPDAAHASSVPTNSGAEGELGVSIEFKDVSFAYDQNSKVVLDHVNFMAQAGKTTAIIGSTGSGKSTVLKLVERFHDVTEGAVLVDGVDVRTMTQHDLRNLFGYVPQQAFLFSGTIESNVDYVGDISNDRRDLALEVAQATQFVAEKEEGLAFEVSQGGTNVSGGQRQRLAIARALALDARGYLFDDSFSALDYKTDAALRAGLAQRLGGRTVVIVAQRIATIMNADHIIVLDEGHVVGQGTHQQLLATCPTYREIALSQLSPEELAADMPAEGPGGAQGPEATYKGGEAR